MRIRSLALVATLCVAWTGSAMAAAMPEFRKQATIEQLVAGKGATTLAYRVTLEGGVFQRKKDGATSPVPLELVLVRKGDRWDPFVGAAASQLNQGEHSGRIREEAAGLNGVVVDVNVGSDRWVKGDPSAEYTLNIVPGDSGVTGSFAGTFQGETVKGSLSGIIVRPGWMNATKTDDGVVAEFDMGQRRVNWNNARWAVMNFMAAVDVSAYDGVLLTLATDEPRQDVGVSFGVMEEDGSWYHVHDAAPLTRKSQTVLIDFEDLRHAEFIFNGTGTGPGVEGNFDEDFHFDRSRAFRVAVGVINPHGVGKVSFRITDLQFVSWKDRDDSPVKVNVTGQTLSVNGQRVVPEGLFGFHAAGGKASAVSDLKVGSLRHGAAQGYGSASLVPPSPQHGVTLSVTFNYDRRQQMMQVMNPNWREVVEKVGRSLGEKAKPHGNAVAVEWWNEPYLDIARTLSRDVDRRANKANAKAGEPVELHGQKLESMVWVEEPVKDREGNITGTKLVPKDPSRFTYWSGRQIGLFYNESFRVMATEAKKVAPEALMIGGFGFRWQEDDWAGWEILYKPLIDSSIDLLDGVCEHHYQGHTDGMAASYEVLQAYTDAVHGKRIPIYNTETNDLWDAPARGNARASSQFGGKYKSCRRMVYNLRDILYCIKETPDKIKARAIHALWNSRGGDKPWEKAGIDEGEWYALKFLVDLRGQLVLAETDDADVWAVASIEPESNDLVVVLFNDSWRTRLVNVSVSAPAGTSFAGGRMSLLGYDGESGDIIATGDHAFKAEGRTLKLPESKLDPAHAVKYVLDLKGDVAGRAAVTHEQIFCGHWAKNRQPIVNWVRPDSKVELPIDLPADATQAKRAWLRLVLERCSEGEGFVTLGGTKLALPKALTPMNAPYIRQMEIDPKLLAGVRSLVFSMPGPEAGNGYVVGMASVVLER